MYVCDGLSPFQARSSIKTDDDFKAAFHLSTALTQAMLSYRLNDASVSWSYVWN